MPLIDLHAHTKALSYCSHLEPDRLIERAKELGLDGVCFTDHDQVWDRERVLLLAEKHQFLVLRGVEVTTNWGHVLVYGLENTAGHIWKTENLRAAVDEAGGAMVLSHPFRTNTRIRSLLESGRHLFHALEVLNGTDHESINKAALALSEEFALPGTAGSDAHELREVGTCATWFDDPIDDERGLAAALRTSRFRPVDLRPLQPPFNTAVFDLNSKPIPDRLP